MASARCKLLLAASAASWRMLHAARHRCMRRCSKLMLAALRPLGSRMATAALRTVMTELSAQRGKIKQVKPGCTVAVAVRPYAAAVITWRE